jgi:hypothetical protein
MPRHPRVHAESLLYPRDGRRNDTAIRADEDYGRRIAVNLDIDPKNSCSGLAEQLRPF